MFDLSDEVGARGLTVVQLCPQRGVLGRQLAELLRERIDTAAQAGEFFGHPHEGGSGIGR